MGRKMEVVTEMRQQQIAMRMAGDPSGDPVQLGGIGGAEALGEGVGIVGGLGMARDVGLPGIGGDEVQLRVKTFGQEGVPFEGVEEEAAAGAAAIDAKGEAVADGVIAHEFVAGGTELERRRIGAEVGGGLRGGGAGAGIEGCGKA